MRGATSARARVACVSEDKMKNLCKESSKHVAGEDQKLQPNIARVSRGALSFVSACVAGAESLVRRLWRNSRTSSRSTKRSASSSLRASRSGALARPVGARRLFGEATFEYPFPRWALLSGESFYDDDDDDG